MFNRLALDFLMKKSYSDQSVISEILDALIDHDMFDFIIQTTFNLPERPKDLPPAEGGPDPVQLDQVVTANVKIDPNMMFIEASKWMWEFVGKIIPKDQLRAKFQAIVPDLRKYIGYTLRWRYMGDDAATRWAGFRLMSECIV